MSYGSILDTDTFSAADIKNLIEGIGVASYPLTWTAYTPTWGASGSMTYTSVTTSYAKYIQIGKLVVALIGGTGTTGGTASNTLIATLPVAAASPATWQPGHVNDTTDQWALAYTDSTSVYFYKAGLAAYGLGTGRACHALLVYWAA